MTKTYAPANCWRLQAEWGSAVRGLALWVPWRRPSQPLLYVFWSRRVGVWKRLFKT